MKGILIKRSPTVFLGEGYKAEIVWRECSFWMDGKSEGVCTLGLGYPKGLEVIGDIYENPDLLQ